MLWWTLRKLKSADPVLRREAVAELARDSSVASTDALIGALTDIDSTVQSRAASALADRRERRALKPMVALLSPDNLALAIRLNKIDPNWPQLPESRAAINKLVALLNPDNLALATGLDKIDPNWPQLPESRAAIDKVARWLTTLEDYSEVGASHIDKVRVSVGIVGRSRDVRHIAVLMLHLWNIGISKQVRDALSQLDPNWSDSTFAKGTIQTLQSKLMTPDCDAAFCNRALDVINETGPSHFFATAPLLLRSGSAAAVNTVLGRLEIRIRVGEPRPALEVLAANIATLETLIKDNKTKEAAAKALRRISNPRAAAALCALLKDPSDHIKAVATAALCESKSLDGACIRPLLEVLPHLTANLDLGRSIVRALKAILACSDTTIETGDLQQLAELQGPTMTGSNFYHAQDAYEQSGVVTFKEQLDCRALNESARLLLRNRG